MGSIAGGVRFVKKTEAVESVPPVSDGVTSVKLAFVMTHKLRSFLVHGRLKVFPTRQISTKCRPPALLLKPSTVLCVESAVDRATAAPRVPAMKHSGQSPDVPSD